MLSFIKSPRFILIIRILAIIISTLVFVYSLQFKNYHFIPVLIVALIIFQIYKFVYFMEKTDRDLNNFLEAIRYSEFSRSFQVEELDSSYNELKKTFNSVIKDFQKIRTEKEESYYFLQNVIHHIGISLIAFNRVDGSVELINNAAKKMFKISSLKNIKSLELKNKKLLDLLLNIKSGEKQSIKLFEKDEVLQLIIFAKEFRIKNSSIILVSLQNIQSELEEQEMIAWQKLIRVLTHEIMNSITPIISLSSTVSDLLLQDSMKQLFFDNYDNDDKSRIKKDLSEDFDDINGAVKTINNRSQGLLHFVEAYRNLSKVPQPNFEIIPVKRLFETIKILFLPEISKKDNLDLVISVYPAQLEITVDEKLIEQVLINLIRNAIQSIDKKISNNNIDENKEMTHTSSTSTTNKMNNFVKLKAFLTDSGKVNISVIDTGEGIIEEVLDKIFIPFFTTKNDGSGIGLSLSKQIIRKHGGSITVNSLPNEKTTFNLIF